MNWISRIKEEASIRIFRDDIYPFLGGGNKGRKMDFIGKEILSDKYDSVVTTGGIQSNHCRAVAVFAAQNRLECSLVLHGDKERFEKESGNTKIIRLSGAEILFSEAKDIGSNMDLCMQEYRNKGMKPYYIYGGGHTHAGGLAYIEAVKNLKEYSDKNKWCPDYIFLASGTGSTQAGIMAGLDKYNFDSTKVIGISVARNRQRAEKVVESFYKELCEVYKIKSTNRQTIVLDDYLCGGYEKYNVAIKEISDNSINKYGFTLDTCYTAKAFYGMKEYIKNNNIKGEILFWHTGGIFNFLAQ